MHKEDGLGEWENVHLNLFAGSNLVLVNEAFTGAMGITALATFATQVRSPSFFVALFVKPINGMINFSIIESLSTSMISSLSNQSCV